MEWLPLIFQSPIPDKLYKYLFTGHACETLKSWEHTISSTAKTREFAEQLLAFEATSCSTQSPSVTIRFSVCDKLYQPLRSFAGSDAAHGLLSRALIMTKIEVPRFAAIQLNQNGELDGFSDAEPPLTQEDAVRGEVIVIANMVELLCTFIGEALALVLIQGVWPDASFVRNDSEKEGEA